MRVGYQRHEPQVFAPGALFLVVMGFPRSMIQGLSENLSLGIRWLAVAEQVAEA